MNADRRTQHAEYCGMERGDMWYDWAVSGNIKRSMLYHSVDTELDCFTRRRKSTVRLNKSADTEKYK